MQGLRFPKVNPYHLDLPSEALLLQLPFPKVPPSEISVRYMFVLFCFWVHGPVSVGLI